jgi:hypothetical protein
VTAAVDEIVFHQILGRHHFYDRATTSAGLLSDGLLHTAELLALSAGFFLYADLRRRGSQAAPHGRAGLLLGMAPSSCAPLRRGLEPRRPAPAAHRRRPRRARGAAAR